MTARIIPFAATAEQAWDAYQALNDEARADASLMFDPDHIRRRADAHELFVRLYHRDLVTPAHKGTAA
jgi:hypothetical protein